MFSTSTCRILIYLQGSKCRLLNGTMIEAGTSWRDKSNQFQCEECKCIHGAIECSLHFCWSLTHCHKPLIFYADPNGPCCDGRCIYPKRPSMRIFKTLNSNLKKQKNMFSVDLTTKLKFLKFQNFIFDFHLIIRIANE